MSPLVSSAAVVFQNQRKPRNLDPAQHSHDVVPKFMDSNQEPEGERKCDKRQHTNVRLQSSIGKSLDEVTGRLTRPSIDGQEFLK